MSLRIYNTLSRALEDFSPLEPGHVRMYVCGMTVYDLCHLGHARSMVAFDVVQRWLRASGLRDTCDQTTRQSQQAQQGSRAEGDGHVGAFQGRQESASVAGLYCARL